MMQAIDSFCLSSFLAFRYVARPDSEWIPGISPVFPEVVDNRQTMVQTAEEILAALTATVMRIPDLSSCGIFLSGGIDSAILAALLPAGTKAYTIDFEAVSGVKESEFAAKYADKNHLDHRVIKVSWDDYLRYEEQLMIHKKAPLHAVEVALFCAATQALRDGVRRIFVGNGADSTFGGMDKLLSRDWTFDEFIKRYTFIAPEKVLLTPYDIRPIYESYRRGEMIDFVGFIKKVHGFGIIQAFGNAAGAAGVELVEPFEELQLRGELDLSRIRAGEPKHQLFEIFRKFYPSLDPPRKIPFARPMDEWLECYNGPSSPCFRRDLEISCFSGDQKYLIRGLDLFVQLLGEARTWL
jgi:hypothetical protein